MRSGTASSRSGTAPFAVALGLALLLLPGCQLAQADLTHRSPRVPPLVSGPSAYATPGQVGAGTEGVGALGAESGEDGEVEGAAAQSEADPLVENGLGSPLCTEASAGLSAAALSDCRTSGFAASAAPTPNYAFDVNIDSGLLGSFSGDFQTYVVKPPWIMLVWAVHALLVGIEWSYTISLLNGPTLGALTGLLGSMQRAVTQPWLALALAIAAATIAWRGIVRRRAATSLGEALAILALIGLGSIMILDPLGTVGRLVRFADSASLEILAAVTGGNSSHPDEALAEGMRRLFADTIDAPWCYMEFGNVAWCEQPGQLDPRLRTAALRIAKLDRAEATESGPQRAAGLTGSATLLEAARSNGAIFLAQPANGPARNSSKWQGSLLAAICRGPNATSCHGATAAEAEFRTSDHTIDRLAGLMLIGAGALGVVLLLGFILARLLGAAVFGLLFMLVAPAAVLLPALGEGGRTAFRDWAARLFGAIVAKLVWSFLLGVVLESMRLLHMLGAFGWWIQWLLMSVLWWGAFQHRHRLLDLSTPFGGAMRGAGGARSGYRVRRLRAGVSRRMRRARYAGARSLSLAPHPWRAQPGRFDPTQTGGDPRPFEPTRLPGPPKPPPDRDAQRSADARQSADAQPGEDVSVNADIPFGRDELYAPAHGPTAEVLAHRRKLVAAKRRRHEEDAKHIAEVVALAMGRKVWKDPKEIEVTVDDARSGPS